MASTFSRRRAIATGAALAAAGLPSSLFAQQGFPNRPVKFVVPFPAGGPVDTTARAMARKLGELWGQACVVDNKAGAGGLVGAEIAAKLPADGYNLFVCSIHHSVL